MNYRLVLLPILLILAALVSVSKKTAATTLDRACTIESSGRTCIFSLTAIATGNLTVSTKACTGGLRFRTIIARINTGEIVSQVGTGSTVTFTGRAVRSTRKGFRFLVIISIESPVPSIFSDAVVIRFAGPFTTVIGPRAIHAERLLRALDCSVATPFLTFGERTDLELRSVFAVPDLTFGERTDLGSRPVFAVPVVPSLPATNMLSPPTNLLLSPTTIFGTGVTGF